MTSRLTEVLFDCADPARLADFWSRVLGYELTDSNNDAAVLEDPEGSGVTVVFLKVPEPKTVKNRVHVDLSPRDRDQAEEVERVIALGATKIDIGQDEPSWVVLADPEGNEFCVLRTRKP